VELSSDEKRRLRAGRGEEEGGLLGGSGKEGGQVDGSAKENEGGRMVVLSSCKKLGVRLGRGRGERLRRGVQLRN
jgi:hypothetical protein